MPNVHVQLGNRSYNVIVSTNALKQTSKFLETAQLSGKIAIISDATVAKFHAPTLSENLRTAGHHVTLHTFPPGEASKSLAQATQLCSALAAAGHDRSTILIALGGGVTGDLAGFVASIFYRGIHFVQIPTTIVSHADSSVGGKTGVNIPEGKNLVGCFHQPRLVIVDPATLQTLEAREFHEGFAEMIKHAAIRDAPMIEELAQLDPHQRLVNEDLLARNIAIKARIVEADEHETKGIRALLNFGHTIGHGIEAAVPYGEILHGEAISLGIRAALFLSEKHANLPHTSSQKILALLQHFSLPTQLPPHLKTTTILTKLSRDKKFQQGQIRFVLLRSLGNAFLSSDVTLDDIHAAIEHIRTPLP